MKNYNSFINENIENLLPKFLNDPLFWKNDKEPKKDIIKIILSLTGPAQSWRGYTISDSYKMLKYVLEKQKEKGNIKKYLEIQDNEGKTPIFDAAYKRREDIIKLLVDYGADINHVSDSWKTTVLLLALAWQENIKLIKTLLDCGADLTYSTYREKDKQNISIIKTIEELKIKYPEYYNKLLSIPEIDELIDAKKYNI